MAVKEPPMFSQCFAEFLGTYMLVFTIGCNVMAGNAVWGGVSIAGVLMVMIYALGPISGAAFNPAVSFVCGVSHLMGGPGYDFFKVAVFSVMQMLGAVFGGISYKFMFGGAFELGPGKGFGWLNAGLVEMIYTFMLCFVVLNVALAAKRDPKVPNDYFGLAIGFVIVAGAYGAGAVSGGCFNPAVALGIELASGTPRWCFLYMMFEFFGAMLAVGFFLVVRPEEFDKNYNEPKSYMRKLVSESIGTYMLVLTVGLNVLGKSPAGAFSIAAALMCMIYSLGDVSGAHFNPAVTVALRMSGLAPEFTINSIACYALAQCIGASLAGGTYSMIYGGATFPLWPETEHRLFAAMWAEMLFTFVLCFVVLTVAACPKTKDTEMFGLAIGSCVTVGGFAIGSMSGGSLNPAISWGISFCRGFKEPLPCFFYIVWEIFGGMIAAGVYRHTHTKVEKVEDGADDEAEEAVKA
jgi:aquaporin Z